MRLFFLIFLVWWIVGIILGVIGSSDVVIVSTVAIGLLLLTRIRLTLQYGVTATVLLLLGYLWGSSAVVQEVRCKQIEEVVQGNVIRIHRIEQSSTQYVVRSGTELCIYLVTAPRFPKFDIGDELRVEGTVQPLSEIPDEYAGYAQYLERQGIDATIRYPTITLIQKSEQPLVREIISTRLNELFAEPEASVLQAMLIARVGSIPESIEEQFKHTSVSHILAISGSNISLLAGSLIGVLLLLPIPASVRVLISIVSLWLYIGMVDYQVSAVRAALFWTVAIIGMYLHVLLSITTIVILTLVGMVSFDPLIITDVGFQLSFAAVIGIASVIFLTRSQEMMKRRKTVVLLLLASLGAVITTWPIIVYYFGTFSAIGLPANIIVVPLTSLFVLGGLLSLILSYIFFPAALVGSFVTHVLWQLINSVTQTMAYVPHAYVENISIPLWGVAMYYVVLAILSMWWMKQSKRSWREVWQ